MSEKAFEEWAILELMGHRRLAGLVREHTIGSGSFIRIDVFVEGEKAIATQFYNPSAVYCMTPVSEELARQIAKRDQPAPVSRWEIPAPPERRVEEPANTTLRRCRVCGCTDDDCSQCIEKTGEPCHWVEADLCSACAEASE